MAPGEGTKRNIAQPEPVSLGNHGLAISFRDRISDIGNAYRSPALTRPPCELVLFKPEVPT